ncbi:hypothetical protein D3C76_1159190 [compost metagenome]
MICRAALPQQSRWAQFSLCSGCASSPGDYAIGPFGWRLGSAAARPAAVSSNQRPGSGALGSHRCKRNQNGARRQRTPHPEAGTQAHKSPGEMAGKAGQQCLGGRFGQLGMCLAIAPARQSMPIALPHDKGAVSPPFRRWVAWRFFVSAPGCWIWPIRLFEAYVLIAVSAAASSWKWRTTAW